ncbi:hypothetical protein CAPTEDRAFT_24117, partial [Capitella teleta]
SPVVFLPGHGGNQLMWKIHLNPDSPDADCLSWNTEDWRRSWLNLWQVLRPGNIDCWSRLLLLEFNENTTRYSNHPGVRVKVPGWGKTHTIERIDPSFAAWIFGDIGAYAFNSWGYSSGLNLFGAPYDFRYGPTSQPNNFNSRLKKLIENAHDQSSGEPVTLLAHSMGGIMAHYFLQSQSQEWKDRYVRSLVTLSTPWRGSVAMVHAVLSGYAWGYDRESLLEPIRRTQRNAQSGFALFPSPGSWGKDEVLVQTAQRNYTAYEYEAMMNDIGFAQGFQMWNDSIYDMSHPGVKVNCYYGDKLPTPQTLVYGEGKFPDSQPEHVSADGDNTVLTRSLRGCEDWKNTALGSKYPVTVEAFDYVTHNQMIKDEKVLKYLEKII